MPVAPTTDGELRGSRRLNMTWLFSVLFSGLAALFFLSLICVFAFQTIPVARHIGIGYFTGTTWFYRTGQFGILPMLYGTAMVSAVALLLAAPVGIGAAIFVSEYLPGAARLSFKVIIELLAGIPSVVYGLLGILFLREWIYEGFARFDPLSGDTLLTAGILLAVMILPTIMTLADDSLRGVPRIQRSAARGLGLTRAETVLYVALPQARPGIVAALLLGLGRALGETIAVFLVVGRQDNKLPETWWSPRPLLEAGQTLTSKLGGSETNIAYGDPLHWAAIVGLGLLLLLVVGGITWVGARVGEKNRA
jgi:phosphate transport system permease protein